MTKVFKYCFKAIIFIGFFLQGTNTIGQVNTQGMNHKEAVRFLSKEKPGMIYIVVRNSNKSLYGNKCVSEYTREMGFEYIMPFDQANSSQFQIFFQNQWSKIRITLKNGLFWKRKVKKRIQKCRTNSGDFLG